MAEPLGELTRTHTCGALRPGDVGANVVLLGWVHRVRDLGGLLFIDVRDRAGVTQVVFDNDDQAQMAKAKRLRSEFVVGLQGVVRRRSDETINQKLDTGVSSAIGNGGVFASFRSVSFFTTTSTAPVSSLALTVSSDRRRTAPSMPTTNSDRSRLALAICA